jgi:hypothetical protein
MFRKKAPSDESAPRMSYPVTAAANESSSSSSLSSSSADGNKEMMEQLLSTIRKLHADVKKLRAKQAPHGHAEEEPDSDHVNEHVQRALRHSAIGELPSQLANAIENYAVAAQHGKREDSDAAEKGENEATEEYVDMVCLPACLRCRKAACVCEMSERLECSHDCVGCDGAPKVDAHVIEAMEKKSVQAYENVRLYGVEGVKKNLYAGLPAGLAPPVSDKHYSIDSTRPVIHRMVTVQGFPTFHTEAPRTLNKTDGDGAIASVSSKTIPVFDINKPASLFELFCKPREHTDPDSDGIDNGVFYIHLPMQLARQYFMSDCERALSSHHTQPELRNRGAPDPEESWTDRNCHAVLRSVSIASHSKIPGVWAPSIETAMVDLPNFDSNPTVSTYIQHVEKVMVSQYYADSDCDPRLKHSSAEHMEHMSQIVKQVPQSYKRHAKHVFETFITNDSMAPLARITKDGFRTWENRFTSSYFDTRDIPMANASAAPTGMEGGQSKEMSISPDDENVIVQQTSTDVEGTVLVSQKDIKAPKRTSLITHWDTLLYKPRLTYASMLPLCRILQMLDKIGVPIEKLQEELIAVSTTINKRQDNDADALISYAYVPIVEESLHPIDVAHAHHHHHRASQNDSNRVEKKADEIAIPDEFEMPCAGELGAFVVNAVLPSLWRASEASYCAEHGKQNGPKVHRHVIHTLHAMLQSTEGMKEKAMIADQLFMLGSPVFYEVTDTATPDAVFEKNARLSVYVNFPETLTFLLYTARELRWWINVANLSKGARVCFRWADSTESLKARLARLEKQVRDDALTWVRMYKAKLPPVAAPNDPYKAQRDEYATMESLLLTREKTIPLYTLMHPEDKSEFTIPPSLPVFIAAAIKGLSEEDRAWFQPRKISTEWSIQFVPLWKHIVYHVVDEEGHEHDQDVEHEAEEQEKAHAATHTHADTSEEHPHYVEEDEYEHEHGVHEHKQKHTSHKKPHRHAHHDEENDENNDDDDGDDDDGHSSVATVPVHAESEEEDKKDSRKATLTFKNAPLSKSTTNEVMRQLRKAKKSIQPQSK